MIRSLKRILSIAVFAFIVFIAVSLWQGGEKFRWFGRTLGDKADVIREKRDEVSHTIKKLTGDKAADKSVRESDDAENPGSHGAGKKPGAGKMLKKTGGEGNDAEKDKDKEGLLSDLWGILRKKIRALVKG